MGVIEIVGTNDMTLFIVKSSIATIFKQSGNDYTTICLINDAVITTMESADSIARKVNKECCD